MKVDTNKSEYHEAPSAKDEFNRTELRRLRLLLRRLRFLEAQGAEENAAESGSGGAQFREWEVEALEWILIEVGYLPEPVSGNSTGITEADVRKAVGP